MLVLHVGPHKTATTWLQLNFHKNTRALRALGWLYPQTGERVRIGHHDLSDFPHQILDPASRKSREFARIAARASQQNLNILLSSEGFRNWRPMHIEALKRLMHPHSMHIVYAVRDPVSLMASFWAQKVKTGSTPSLPKFLKWHMRRSRKSRLANPLVEIKKFSKVPGVRLTLLMFDEIRRQERDIFDVFVGDVLSLSALPKAASNSVNERQPIEMTEFMRLLLLRMDKWKGPARVNIGRVFRYLLTGSKKIRIIETVNAADDARRTIVIRRDRRGLLTIEKKLLRRYRTLMSPQPEHDKLFLSGPESLVYYDGDALEADANVHRLLDEMQRTFKPGGIRIQFANFTRFWLLRWRRFLKLVR